MKNLFLLLALFQIQLIFSQQSKVDLKIKEKIEFLKKENIDTIVIFNEDCVGCKPKILLKENCVPENIKYLFWIKNGISYKQKFDGCTNFEEIKTNNPELMKTIVKNPQKIENSIIKKPEHKVNKKETISLLVDHFAYYDFEFYFKNQKIDKRVIDYELETKMIDKKMPNDNYYFNQKSILKKILDLVNEEIY